MGNVTVDQSNIFVIPLLKIECSDWQNKKQKLNELSSSLKFFPRFGMSTDWGGSENEDPKCIEIIEEIFSEELSAFKNHFSFSFARIITFWFEETQQGSFHGYHSHGVIGYSAICYLNFDKNDHLATLFTAPFFNFLNGKDLTHRPDVKEGDLLFFPSSVYHQSLPNLSSLPRKIVSFNLKVPKVTN